MLLQLDETNKNTYGFEFATPSKLDEIATICVIGCECRKTVSQYYWDCNLRADTETFIFQYTFSGRGAISIKGEVQQLSEGMAFIVAVPEDCQYYLPPTSAEWQFIFITLGGVEAKKCWEYINQNFGYVFEISRESTLIQCLIATYAKVIKGEITDAYRVSNQAYEFITYCYQYFDNRCRFEVVKIPDDVTSAVDFIKENYALQLSIEEIADHVGLSKSYLNKKFKEHLQLPPLKYLNKYRIEKSLYLLQHTKKSVKEISGELGFLDPNYFCKVFRKTVGVAPGIFRKTQTSHHDFNTLITDQHGIIDL